jgi:hypothetical protein
MVVNDKLEKFWREAIVEYPNIFTVGLRKTTTSVRIHAVPAEIRTEHLSNKSQERYRYANLLDLIFFTVAILVPASEPGYFVASR